MASIQAQFVSFLTRAQIKRQLKSAASVEDIRRAFNGSLLRPPKHVTFTSATMGGVPGEWAESNRSDRSKTLLYLHGGGYVACSPKTHRPITGFFAQSGFRVFAPDYRLAPENPFPAALDDAVAVWQELTRDHVATVAGDSAGGNLSLALMLRLKMGGHKLPAAAALFSPVTDFTGGGSSLFKNLRRDAMLAADKLAIMREAYVGRGNPGNPLVSPLFGDLKGLPPLLIHVGGSEVLLDDSTRFAQKAEQAGVKVELKVWEGVPHVWQMAHGFVPEARASMKIAAAFLSDAWAASVTAH
jgi:monoterpene epsilon-lactone hydrolase